MVFAIFKGRGMLLECGSPGLYHLDRHYYSVEDDAYLYQILDPKLPLEDYLEEALKAEIKQY